MRNDLANSRPVVSMTNGTTAAVNSYCLTGDDVIFIKIAIYDSKMIFINAYFEFFIF